MNKIFSCFCALALFTLLGISGLPAFCQEDATAEKAAAPEKKEPEATASTATVNKPYARDAIEHFNQGVELHKTGYLTKAIAAYKAAIKADERIEQAWSNLALLYTAQKNWSKALEAFDKALELKPNSTTSLNGLGTVLFAMKKNKEAMEKWQKVVELDPNFASAYYNMGYALEMDEKRPEALKAYLKALNIAPEMSDSYYRIGVILQSTNHPAQAKLFLSRAVNLDPEGAFIRDAQKQLSSIAHDLDKNTTSTTSGADPASPSGSEASNYKKSEGRSDTKSSADVKEPGRRGGLISNFAMKLGLGAGAGADSKNQKQVDMFVQPPQGESDLKPKTD